MSSTVTFAGTYLILLTAAFSFSMLQHQHLCITEFKRWFKASCPTDSLSRATVTINVLYDFWVWTRLFADINLALYSSSVEAMQLHLLPLWSHLVPVFAKSIYNHVYWDVHACGHCDSKKKPKYVPTLCFLLIWNIRYVALSLKTNWKIAKINHISVLIYLTYLVLCFTNEFYISK